MEIDIFSIDKKIKDVWNKNQKNIVHLENEIRRLRQLIIETEISPHVKRDLQEKLHCLEQEKEKTNSILENQHFYTMDVSELLETYHQAAPQKISFMSKQKPDKNMSSITSSYLDILKKYDIDYKELEDLTKNQKKSKKVCSLCNSQEFITNFDQNLEICENCGKQEEKSHKSTSFKDITRINLSNKYNYERRIHFKDCINQYQGKQNATIADKVYQDLEEQFEQHGLLTASPIKKTRFESITKEHVLLFLKETNHSKHYEDVVLIYHKMTGKPIDDISHLEPQLMEDFDKISNLYDKRFKFTGKIDRKSFINTQYVLFQLLRKYKYPCKKEDFNMLKTLDRKSFHDDIVRELFETLNFNFTPIF
uniref:Uncharacterized protein n=1 Tax=viral metagenome TaxID=1070528 RepID=A0A6C0KEV5_9ZZZZ